MNAPLAQPKDMGAECQLIGCCVTRPELLEEVGDLVAQSHFTNRRYGLFWAAMSALSRAHGTFDPAMIYSWLKEARQFEAADALVTMSECLDLVGTTINAVHYAERIRDYARRRAIIDAAESIAAGGYGEVIEDVDAWAVECERTLAGASNSFSADTTRTVVEAWDAFERHVTTDDPDEETGPPLATHFPTFNEHYSAGGFPRKLCVIAGRPGMGKTAIAMSLSAQWLQDGARGGFFSMEMAERELTGRYASMLSGVHYRRLVDKKQPLKRIETEDFLQAGHEMRKWGLHFDFSTALTASQISGRARRLQRKLGALDFIVVDHFHLMDHGLTGKRRDDAQMGVTSGILRDLAKDLDVCVLLLAQLSRRVEERGDKRPIMADIRECGAIEQDAHFIVSPFWPHYYAKGNDAKGIYGNDQVQREEAELLVLKNRDGQQGTIPLRFNPECVRYSEARQ